METLIAVRMLLEAYGAEPLRQAAGWVTGLAMSPPWWIHQIIVDALVVGDAGFHGPPAAGAACGDRLPVVPAPRRGLGTQACGLLWSEPGRDGADMVRADTEPDNVASRAVLRANGFSLRPGRRLRGAGPERAAP